MYSVGISRYSAPQSPSDLLDGRFWMESRMASSLELLISILDNNLNITQIFSGLEIWISEKQTTLNCHVRDDRFRLTLGNSIDNNRDIQWEIV
jgi:hypothetical protein